MLFGPAVLAWSAFLPRLRGVGVFFSPGVFLGVGAFFSFGGARFLGFLAPGSGVCGAATLGICSDEGADMSSDTMDVVLCTCVVVMLPSLWRGPDGRPWAADCVGGALVASVEVAVAAVSPAGGAGEAELSRASSDMVAVICELSVVREASNGDAVLSVLTWLLLEVGDFGATVGSDAPSADPDTSPALPRLLFLLLFFRFSVSAFFFFTLFGFVPRYSSSVSHSSSSLFCVPTQRLHGFCPSQRFFSLLHFKQRRGLLPLAEMVVLLFFSALLGSKDAVVPRELSVSGAGVELADSASDV